MLPYPPSPQAIAPSPSAQPPPPESYIEPTNTNPKVQVQVQTQIRYNPCPRTTEPEISKPHRARKPPVPKRALEPPGSRDTGGPEVLQNNTRLPTQSYKSFKTFSALRATNINYRPMVIIIHIYFEISIKQYWPCWV